MNKVLSVELKQNQQDLSDETLNLTNLYFRSETYEMYSYSNLLVIFTNCMTTIGKSNTE